MEEFRHILFYEANHSYINVNNQKKYTSVTTMIKSLFPQFDKEYWAVYKHLERQGNEVKKLDDKFILLNNKPVHYEEYLDQAQLIIQEWQDKATNSANRGSSLHLWLENAFNNKVINVDCDTSVAEKFWKDHRHMTPVYAECIVADDKVEVAGQVDRPFLVGENTLDIYDYKFIRELKMYNPFEKGIDNLDNCSWNHYMLQLNSYRAIIEKNTKYKVRNLKLVHLTEEDYKIYDVPKYNMYDIFRSFINNKTNH